jgi:hypothetical protein
MDKTVENKAELERIVNEKFEIALDKLFVEVHEIAHTRSGDIEPIQVMEKNDLSEKLVKLIVEQVWQNL